MATVVTVWSRSRFPRPKRISRWSGRGLSVVNVKHGPIVVAMRFESYRGYHLASVTRYSNGDVVSRREYPWRKDWMKKIAVGGAGSSNPPEHLANPESTLLAGLPSLRAHCSCTRYEDGSARKPGWFTVKTMGSAWVVQVKDPDAGAQMQVTSQTLDDALTMADLLVGSEGAPWEPDAYLRATQSRKK